MESGRKTQDNIKALEKELGGHLCNFVSTHVIHSVQRLMSADLKTLYRMYNAVRGFAQRRYILNRPILMQGLLRLISLLGPRQLAKVVRSSLLTLYTTGQYD